MRSDRDGSGPLLWKLRPVPRFVLLVAGLLMIPAAMTPLWKMTMFAPQYQEGLRLEIYPSHLDGDHGGQDVHEINVLNHYIGMRELSDEAFPEFRWIPFALAILGVVLLGAALLGRIYGVLVTFVVYLAFSGYALFTFVTKLYRYGHELAPDAAVKVPPFMPPLFGYKQMANFEVYSYPAVSAYILVAVLLALVAVLVFAFGFHHAGDGKAARA